MRILLAIWWGLWVTGMVIAIWLTLFTNWHRKYIMGHYEQLG